jgi:RHH-type rel operon transcriptional repressor/antitoxin RelB
MDALLEKELELAAKRQGVTKSQFVIDAVERALGHKDPYKLLLQVRQEAAAYVVSSDVAAAAQAPAQENADVPQRQKLRSILHAQHQAESDDWLAYQAAKSQGKDWTPS